MKSKTEIWKIFVLGGILFFLTDLSIAGNLPGSHPASDSKEKEIPDSSAKDSIFERRFFSFFHRFSHRVELEVRPGYIFPTNSFLRGENYAWKPIKNSLSAHLKYAFQFHPGTYADRMYGGAYQGMGIAAYNFKDRQQLGNPIAFYLFQGARIARFTSWLSLNYEWNFGLSWGWKPYHPERNSFNKVIGSKINAYLNTNFYLNWRLASGADFTSGITLTHFSNGNTSIPNAGLNSIGLKLGLVYYLNRKENFLLKPVKHPGMLEFPRHFSYDLVFFGSWRRKGVSFNGEQVASPDAYSVWGFNFATMYNLSYKFRLGVSLDGVYDGSANVYTEDYIVGTTQEFFKPPFRYQLALGMSGRAEFVMPYFTVGIGMGGNVLHRGGDLKAFYQILALKMNISRWSFLHIGYSLQDFRNPNFLMLGIGFRFNNKYPSLFRR